MTQEATGIKTNWAGGGVKILTNRTFYNAFRAHEIYVRRGTYDRVDILKLKEGGENLRFKKTMQQNKKRERKGERRRG